MSQPYARAFYNSAQWEACKNSYLAKVGRLCERCLLQGYVVPAAVVHHKIHITPQNINDPNVTLNHDNLQALCMDCHAEVHKGERRWTISEDGVVSINDKARENY